MAVSSYDDDSEPLQCEALGRISPCGMNEKRALPMKDNKNLHQHTGNEELKAFPSRESAALCEADEESVGAH